MADRRMSGLSKGLQVIQRFVYDKDAWGIRELSRELGFSKSAVQRLLQSLCDEDFLALDGKDNKYKIGPELWRLGAGLRGKENLHNTAMTVIRKYADKMNEMMLFFRYGHGGVIYEGVAECDHDLRFSMRLGIPYDIHRGPAGKIIMAFLAPDERENIFDLLQRDPAIDIRNLRKLVEQARIDGYSTARGERVAGVIGFSAPVIGPENVLLGGVGLYLPDARYREEEKDRYIDTVKACAAEISSIVNPNADGKNGD
jgi:DNA-binding IclR family transcriptional regulator